MITRSTVRLVAVSTLAAAAVVAIPSSAVAQERYTDPQGRFIETSHTELGDTGCSITITLRNNSGWIYPTSVYIDGGPRTFGPTVDNRAAGPNGPVLNGPIIDRSATRTITFTDGQPHTIRYLVEAGTENNLYLGHDVGESTTIEFPALSLRERVERGCIERAEEPETSFTDTPESFVDCDDEALISRTRRETTAFEYDPDTNTWSEIDPVVTYLDEESEPLDTAALEDAGCDVDSGGAAGPGSGGEDVVAGGDTLADAGAPPMTSAWLGALLLAVGGVLVAATRRRLVYVPLHRIER